MLKRWTLAAGVALGAVGALAAAGAVVVKSDALRAHLQEHIPASWLAKVNQWRFGYSVDHGIRLTMPDGVKLAASLYIPRTAQGKGPTVLLRVPYDRLEFGEALGGSSFFARNGYIVLVVDLRGTGQSEGEFIPYRSGTRDGAAVLNWIAAQPWSNGRVGSYGCSALGETQFVLARANHPAHTAMIALGAGGGLGLLNGRASYGGNFEGGVFNLASGFGWFSRHGAKSPSAPAAPEIDNATTLPMLPTDTLAQRVRPVPNGYEEYIGTPLADPWWKSLDYAGDGDVIAKPSLIINSWGDQTIGDTLALSEWVRQSAPAAIAKQQHVVIAPGDHCDHNGAAMSGRFGDIEVRNAEQPYNEWFLRWFDQQLRGEGSGLDDMPPYLYYMIGEHRWLKAERWPPETVSPQRWYLNSAGHANTAVGDGSLSPITAVTPLASLDEFHYDPMNPAPTRGGPFCCTGNPNERYGPLDQREVESRADVLVYTSAPMPAPLRIAGPLHARLHVSSSARDTDFVARLTHVWPDGRATSIQEGALRARYREGIATPKLLQPGEVVPIDIDMRSIAYTIPTGHRLRLDITSSSFPRLERNLNTGGANHDESKAAIALNRVHHDPAQTSFIELPVLPAGE